jgi:hypothetical protein
MRVAPCGVSRTLFVAVESHTKACVSVGLVNTSSMQERPPHVGHVLPWKADQRESAREPRAACGAAEWIAASQSFNALIQVYSQVTSITHDM